MIEDQKDKKAKSDRAGSIIQEQSRLASDRMNFDSHWQEIAERIVPVHKDAFNSFGQRTKGEKRNEFIFDSTASLALGKFSSIMDSLLTPRNQTWHKLKASDDSLNKQKDVQNWFDELNRALFRNRYAPTANFMSQNQMVYKSLGAYGSGAMFIDALDGMQGGLRYRNIHLAEMYFVENHQGMVDKVLRKFRMTARQAYQKWGERLPRAIVSAAGKTGETEYEFIHCVRPREEYDPNKMDAVNKPVASEYVSIEGAMLLSESGYDSFPYAVTRYEQDANEVYGRSPAMDVLPAVKTLNEQKKTLLKQGHRAVDPVIFVNDDGIMSSMSLKPGAINAGGVSAAGQPLFATLPVGNPAFTKEMMDDERQVINDAFFVTLFQILVDTPQMSATEVLERTKEKGMLLAPTVGRQQSEYLGPMIEREIDVLMMQGMISPMPQALIEARGDYRIEYESPLSRAQRSEEGSGLMRTIETVLNVVNVTQDPSHLDYFNMDVAIPELSDINGVPPRWVKTFDEVAQMREQRAQQQQKQEMIQAAPAAAAMIKAQAVAKKR